jgi:O-antigen/teichoic acid export membrane protein
MGGPDQAEVSHNTHTSGRNPLARRFAGRQSEGSTVTRASWMLAGLIAGALSQWLIVVLLARLGPVAVGQYALGLAVCAPIIAFASLALRTVLVTESSSTFNFERYLYLRIISMALALAGIAAVATFFYPKTSAIIVAVGVAKSLDSIGDIFNGLMQRNEMMRICAGGMIANGAFTGTISLIFWIVSDNALCVVAGSVVGSLLGSVAFPTAVALRFRRLKVTWRTASHKTSSRLGARRLLELTRVSMPLGFALGVASISVNLPRYFVEADLGETALGVFAVAGHIVLAANMCFAAVAQATIPKISRWVQAGHFDLASSITRRLVFGSVLVGAVSVAIFGLVGRQLVQVIYGEAYVPHFVVFVLFAVAAAISGPSYFLGSYLSALRSFKEQAAVSLTTLAITFLASAVSISAWGLRGAGMVIIAGIIVESSTKCLLLTRSLRGRLLA